MIDAIFIGLSTIDCVYVLSAFPAENAKTTASQFYCCSGGPATNAAIAYAQLGGKPLLMTPAGASVFGKQIENECVRYGCALLDLSGSSYEFPTLSSIAITSAGKARTV